LFGGGVAASKLSIYNGALTRFLGERKLSSLTESREPRRALDDVWDQGGVKTCLQMAQWNFAINSAQLDYDPSISPPFGYRRAFAKPDDFVRTAGVCQDEYFHFPLTQYQDNSGYWLCDLDTIWVRYVSDDDNFGMDFSKWPPNFTRYVEGYFASQIAAGIATDQAKALTTRDVEKLLLAAKATDSAEEPVGRVPAGSWSRARHRNAGTDRNPSGSLY
jgi:hypothetical protein